MATRITNLIRDRLMVLAKMKVVLRAYESDMGRQIAEAHEALRMQLITIIKGIFPVKEMNILFKWDRASVCEAVALNIARIDTETKEADSYAKCNYKSLPLYPFNFIVDRRIRGEFYEKLFNEHQHPQNNRVKFDKRYTSLDPEKFKLTVPLIPQGYQCSDTMLPGIGGDYFYGLDTGRASINKEIFDPILKDYKIFFDMLADLNADIEDKLCPYYSLIKAARNLEVITKAWTEAEEILVFLASNEKSSGNCKIMGIEEAAMKIKQDLAEAA